MDRSQLILIHAALLLSSVSPTQAADPKPGDKPPETAAPTPEAISYEYTCKSGVSYSWKLVPEQGKRPAFSTEPKTVLFSSVQVTETTEDITRAKLDQALIKAKQSALIDCQQKHENTSLCLAFRLKSIADSYEQSDYQTRKLLMDAAKKDCENQAGECLAINSTEISCTKTEKKKETTEPAKAPENKAEEEKKGAKKK